MIGAELYTLYTEMIQSDCDPWHLIAATEQDAWNDLANELNRKGLQG